MLAFGGDLFDTFSGGNVKRKRHSLRGAKRKATNGQAGIYNTECRQSVINNKCAAFCDVQQTAEIFSVVRPRTTSCHSTYGRNLCCPRLGTHPGSRPYFMTIRPRPMPIISIVCRVLLSFIGLKRPIMAHGIMRGVFHAHHALVYHRLSPTPALFADTKGTLPLTSVVFLVEI